MPWIIFTIPSALLFQQSVSVVILILFLDVVAMVRQSKTAARVGPSALIFSMTWGKVASDLYGLPGPDTALLLFQFMVTIFFLEASATLVVYGSTTSRLGGGGNQLSGLRQVNKWAEAQLADLGRLTLVAFGLSLALLLLGSIASVSLNQIAFTAALVVATVVVILFLLTNRREPEPSKH